MSVPAAGEYPQFHDNPYVDGDSPVEGVAGAEGTCKGCTDAVVSLGVIVPDVAETGSRTCKQVDYPAFLGPSGNTGAMGEVGFYAGHLLASVQNSVKVCNQAVGIIKVRRTDVVEADADALRRMYGTRSQLARLCGKTKAEARQNNTYAMQVRHGKGFSTVRNYAKNFENSHYSAILHFIKSVLNQTFVHMSLEIKKVSGRKALRQFVLFPERLYRNNPYYVPKIVFDEMGTLDPATNPASAFCKFELYMAFLDGVPAGRVAAIINYKANEAWKHDEVRFGWFDTIDNPEVARALIAAVEDFGRANGMKEIVGPLGFTDFDPEGLLVEGFDQISTMPLFYSYPYYQKHIEALGFEKDADWLEYVIKVPDQIPAKIERVSAIARERYGFRVRQVTRKLIRKEDYAHKIFKLLGDTYKDLYEYTVLPEDMADKYIGFYLKLLDLRYLSVVENAEGELVAVGITMPSLAKALQKSHGRIFPFGWWHLLKALFIKHSDGAELLLMGARPDVRRTGVTALVVEDIFRKYKKLGVKWAETNAELEDNHSIRNHFGDFERVQNKRRRSYRKKL